MCFFVVDCFCHLYTTDLNPSAKYHLETWSPDVAVCTLRASMTVACGQTACRPGNLHKGFCTAALQFDPKMHWYNAPLWHQQHCEPLLTSYHGVTKKRVSSKTKASPSYFLLLFLLPPFLWPKCHLTYVAEVERTWACTQWLKNIFLVCVQQPFNDSDHNLFVWENQIKCDE